MVILNHRLCCHDLKQEIGSRLISSMGKRENDSIICIICVTHPPSRLVVGVELLVESLEVSVVVELLK